MNIEELREFCLNLEFTTEEVLWDGVLVFKVGGKMFCFAPLDEDPKINLNVIPMRLSNCGKGSRQFCRLPYEQKVLEYRIIRWNNQ